MKVEFKDPSELLQLIMSLEWKWEVISMEFTTFFPRTVRQYDSIMVVVDMLIDVAHFILVKSTFSASDVAQVFIMNMVRLHGALKKIVSEGDANLTSKFWKDLSAGLSIEFAFSIAYHPQTYGKIERVNRILEDMLRMYVIHQEWKWEEYLPLVEFSYNNGY